MCRAFTDKLLVVCESGAGCYMYKIETLSASLRFQQSKRQDLKFFTDVGIDAHQYPDVQNDNVEHRYTQ